MKQKSILYLTYNAIATSTAAHANTTRRKLALEKAGYIVILFHHTPDHFFSDCRKILRQAASVNCMMIRIDGSGILDKFTVLKLFAPRLTIIWELHGFPQENSAPTLTLFQRFKNYMRRRILSSLTTMVICISKELETYAKTQIHMKNSAVIPNFVLPYEYRITQTAGDTVLETFSNRFLVCWGGDASLAWHALDTIERVAQIIYARDPTILFIIVGSNPWHEFRWHKNIILLSRLPRPEFLRLIRRANLCLALYHKPKETPFYFAPLKILDYMALHKPVIASNQHSIRSIITNNINGLLTTNHPDAIAAKILLLKHNTALAKKLGSHAGQTILKHFSIKQAQHRYTKALNFLE